MLFRLVCKIHIYLLPTFLSDSLTPLISVLILASLFLFCLCLSFIIYRFKEFLDMFLFYFLSFLLSFFLSIILCQVGPFSVLLVGCKRIADIRRIWTSKPLKPYCHLGHQKIFILGWFLDNQLWHLRSIDY